MGARRCPRDRQLLTFRRVQGVGLNVCPSCAGVFLDRGVLEQMLPGFHSADLRSLRGFRLARTGPNLCPSCNKPMVSMRYGPVKTAFEIDKCVTCGGLWLDGRELEGMVEATEPVRRVEKMPVFTLELPPEGEAITPEPWSVKALLSFLFGVPVGEERRTGRFAPATLVLIGLCIVVYLLAGAQAVGTWGLDPHEVLRGHRLPTLVTAIFFHATLLHLLGNMYFLFLFGDNVEEAVGSGRFIPYFLLVGIIANLLVTLLCRSPPGVVHVGASGAISGIMGTYFVLYPSSEFIFVPRFYLRPFRIRARSFLLLWVGYQVLLLALAPDLPVDLPAHLGGFAAGVAAGFAAKRRSKAVPL